MSTSEFLLVYGICFATILLCRCVPMFVLKGRQLSQEVQDALNLIPPAAFAALVTNDLFKVGMFDAGPWPGALPLIAAAVVVAVAWKTRSLIWCAIAGVVCYALLSIL